MTPRPPVFFSRIMELSARHRAAAALIATGVLGLGIGSGVLATRLTSAHPEVAADQLSLQPTASPSSVEPTPIPSTSSWWRPLPTAKSAFQPAQLVIEKLKVQAPVVVKGVDAKNVMEAPDRPTDVAWYRFTAMPGAGTNAVFSGHRDFGQVGNQAVFWYLAQLTAGDAIDVVSDHQTEIRYRVTQTWDYSIASMPMPQVLAREPTDEITLITCSGTYVRGGYDHRFVVRALRAA